MIQFIEFLSDIVAKRSLLWVLTKRDFKTRFAGSFLGILWIFIQPFLTIMIFWFIFQMAYKLKPVNDYPFAIWLTSGMIPWFFFSDAILSAAYSIAESSYLVKKVAFRVSLLPLVRILSAILVHTFFIVFLFVMFAFYGFYPDIYTLQLFYYSFAMIVLITGLSWITSSSILFFKDVGQLIQAILQFLFWGTGIFWSINFIPERYHPIIKLNPVYYIINGYREALIDKVWFWAHPKHFIYFWSITLLIFILGAIVFKKLRPHFGDVV